MNDILVTGIGIISSLGYGKEANLKSLLSEISGISSMKYLKSRHDYYPVGEVNMSDIEMKRLLSLPDNYLITRTSLLGRLALKEAITDSKLDITKANKIAFISGTTVGGMEKSEIYYSDFLTNNTNSEYIALHDCGACTELIAEEYKEKINVVTTLSTACSSAANAIILGANLIKTGRAELAIVGGTECLSKFHINGFNTLMILDKEQCKPFDANRKGLNLGEGAAYIVLESAKSAKERNVKAICKLSGYANTCDAYHQTASSPEGEGAYLAIMKAMKNANLITTEIDYINAHGTGTENNDESEGTAIMRVFGEKVPFTSSTKAFTGHTTSAAGGIEAVISILALKHNFVPANLNFKEKINKLNFNPVSKTIKNIELNNVITNSFGFGGNNTVCIFSKI